MSLVTKGFTNGTTYITKGTGLLGQLINYVVGIITSAMAVYPPEITEADDGIPRRGF